MNFFRRNSGALIIVGIILIIFYFTVLFYNNFYEDKMKTTVLRTGEIQVFYGDGLKDLKDVNTTGLDDITYYKDITIEINGKETVFKDSQQTVRKLANINEEITIYKDKNGNIQRYTNTTKFMNFFCLFTGIILLSTAFISKISIKRK